MKDPVVAAFCSDAGRASVIEAVDVERVRRGRQDRWLAWPESEGIESLIATGRPCYLIAVGGEGGAALGRWIETHGLDGVAGVGLVGVTAPWAARRMCPACRSKPLESRTAANSPMNRAIARGETHYTCGLCRGSCVQIGPLEPLRGVAERARRCASLCPSCRSERVRPDTDNCTHFVCVCGHAFTSTPIRLVIACAPDDGVCAGCKGVGVVCEAHAPDDCDCESCECCDGRGECLSSANVACELVGDPMRAVTPDVACYRDVYGGIKTLQYESRDALAEHGLCDVVERLAR